MLVVDLDDVVIGCSHVLQLEEQEAVRQSTERFVLRAMLQTLIQTVVRVCSSLIPA